MKLHLVVIIILHILTWNYDFYTTEEGWKVLIFISCLDISGKQNYFTLESYFSTKGHVNLVLVYGYAFQASSSTVNADFGNKDLNQPGRCEPT